jgi:hypothetical protein
MTRDDLHPGAEAERTDGGLLCFRKRAALRRDFFGHSIRHSEERMNF